MKLKYLVNFVAALVLMAGIFITPSCKKYKDPAPVPAPTGPSITIQQLRNMYTGTSIRFTSNTILNVVVTCDETSGNLYKQVYVRDNSGAFSTTHNYGAIGLHFTSGTLQTLTTGDSVAINLNGSSLNISSGGSLEIDSLVPNKQGQITHLGLAKVVPQPIVTTISQIDTFLTANGGGFIFDAQLVELANVEFIKSNVGTTYAVAQGGTTPPQSINKYINDFAGNTIVAYNSGYAGFANNIIPANSGTITAIANLYSTMQLTLRNYSDIQLTNPYQQITYDVITPVFPVTSYPPFTYQAYSKNNPMVMAGWVNIAYIGSLSWESGQYGSPNTANGNPPNWTYHPSASNYQSPDPQPVNEMWLISPQIVDNGNGKYIDFSVATQFGLGTSARLLSVLVSRTFDGAHLDPSQWQDISAFFPAIPSSGSFTFKYAAHNSTTANPIHINVSSIAGGNNTSFYLAFKYRSNSTNSDSTGTTYALGALALHN